MTSSSPNQWQVFKAGQPINSVRDHGTAQQIVRALKRRFPSDQIEIYFNGSPLPIPETQPGEVL